MNASVETRVSEAVKTHVHNGPLAACDDGNVVGRVASTGQGSGRVSGAGQAEVATRLDEHGCTAQREMSSR